MTTRSHQIVGMISFVRQKFVQNTVVQYVCEDVTVAPRRHVCVDAIDEDEDDSDGQDVLHVQRVFSEQKAPAAYVCEL